MKMNFLATILQKNQNELAVSRIITSNAITEKYALTLTVADAKSLLAAKEEILSKNGRIQFEDGLINKMIFAFCTSPYISQFNYRDTMHELIEVFFYFKNETFDSLDDDTLIAIMKYCFDEHCQGSLELLSLKTLETIGRKIREGDTQFGDILALQAGRELEDWND